MLVRINSVLIIQDFERPITNSGLILTIANKVITFRSLIRIKLNNSNIFRTRLSFYNSARLNELFRNLDYLRSVPRFNRMTIATIKLLNRVELVFVALIYKITNVNITE